MLDLREDGSEMDRTFPDEPTSTELLAGADAGNPEAQSKLKAMGVKRIFPGKGEKMPTNVPRPVNGSPKPIGGVRFPDPVPESVEDKRKITVAFLKDLHADLLEEVREIEERRTKLLEDIRMFEAAIGRLG